jgi:S1-C subfamily serine protease
MSEWQRQEPYPQRGASPQQDPPQGAYWPGGYYQPGGDPPPGGYPPGAYQPAGYPPYPPGPPPAQGYPPGQVYPPAQAYPPAQEYPPARRARAGVVAASVIAFVVLIAAAAGGLAVGLGLVSHGKTTGTTSANQPGGVSIPAPSDAATPAPTGAVNADAVAQAVDPGVVDVNTVLGYQNARAAGTGIVLKSSGIVLTNNHVVAGATSITVTEVTDGRTYSATVVGYDRSDDIAVLQLSGASGLPTVSLADSSSVNVGDQIVAIGNAGGTGGTPSVVTGAVTALNQSITASDQSSGASERLTGLIEVAAAIQAGDSGGPLVNASGKVIGIDTAATAGFRYRQAGGQGYAIPINTAVTIANQILGNQASATVHLGGTAFLGVQAAAADSGTGAAVAGVVANSPAESGGLATGDVITSLDGQQVDSPTTLTTLLDAHHPGDRVTIGWVDAAGQSHSAQFSLATGPVG